MSILLTHAYYLYEDPAERAVMRPYPPLGILYIASHLRAKGIAAEVFDTTFRTPADFHAYVLQQRPRAVGIYCNLMTRGNALGMIRLCKEAGAHVIVGGPEPASYAEEYLAAGADVVVVGEGELTLTELVPHLEQHGPLGMQHIAGIVYRDGDGALCRTADRAKIADLDAQPFPQRDAIDIGEYVRVWRQHHGMGSVSLITARGCPYKCNWCSHAVFGFSHRRRGVVNVADELELIRDTYRPDMVWYADDVFTIQHKWLHAYNAELKRRGIKIPFETISREDRLNEAVVKALAEMGCQRLWIGAESGSQRILNRMERATNAERVREMVRLLQRHGIEAGMFIMLGYDGEEVIDLEATVEHLKLAIPDRVLTTVAYPIKGTAYYEKVADRVIPLKAWKDGSDRDFTVAGRHSRRFYEYATRWMVNEVALHKQLQVESPSLAQMARAFLNAQVGRMGMRLTEAEVEDGQLSEGRR